MFINRHSISLKTKIQPSIYETNSFLIKKSGLTLIEYAVFFGSIQIYNYLCIEKVELTISLWPLAIHGKNSDILHSLEDNHVELNDMPYLQLFYEALKYTFNQSLKYYNFAFLKNELINESSFYNLCKYDYYTFVDSLLESKFIDINKKESEKTSLFVAIEKENVEIIKLLLTNDKIDVNILNKEHILNYEETFTYDEFYQKETALFLAIEKENVEIVKLLLENDKIEINILSKIEGEEEWEALEKSALYAEIEKENIEIIKLLLTNDKLDISILNKYEGYWKKYENDVCKGVSDEWYSKQNEHAIIQKSYISITFKSNHFNEIIKIFHKTALYKAIEKENIEIIKLLLNNDKINVNILNKENLYIDEEKTALFAAIEKENIEIVKLLLANDKVDINILKKYDGYEIGGDYEKKKLILRKDSIICSD